MSDTQSNIEQLRRAEDRADRASDRTERASDRAQRAEQFSLLAFQQSSSDLIRRWTNRIITVLYLIMLVMWSTVLVRQNGIIENLTEIRQRYEKRTEQFDRIEEMERQQMERMQAIFELEKSKK